MVMRRVYESEKNGLDDLSQMQSQSMLHSQSSARVYTSPPESMDVVCAKYREVPPIILSSSLQQQAPQAMNQRRTNPQSESLLKPAFSKLSKIVFNLITNTSPDKIEDELSSTGISPSSVSTEEVLKLVYDAPSAAIKFFHWANRFNKPSAHSWNLMVDLLGKNQRFEEMWDAIRTMREEGVLSVTTFASVFSRYCSAKRVGDAVMTFEIMEKYGIKHDVFVLNSLLSAFCMANHASDALIFFQKVKPDISPDLDTFTILFEGFQKERNLAKAKTTFGEMVVHIGWNKEYSVAYDAFLLTLLQGSNLEETMKFLRIMQTKSCLPTLRFFTYAIAEFAKKNDVASCVTLWDTMVGGGVLPDVVMYNSMIGLMCTHNDFDSAFHFLDEMVFCGAFPDSVTYNTIFECLIKNRKAKEVVMVFVEMVKNELAPTHENSASAIHLLFEQDDPETAMDVWNFMIGNGASHMEDSANEVLLGLCKLERLEEIWPVVDEMFVAGIVIFKTTMEILKTLSYNKGRSAQDLFDTVSRRWREPS